MQYTTTLATTTKVSRSCTKPFFAVERGKADDDDDDDDDDLQSVSQFWSATTPTTTTITFLSPSLIVN